MASPSPVAPDIVEVDRVPIADLMVLLDRERSAWRQRLGWDPAVSTASMIRAIEWGIVRGAVLRQGGRPVAYLLQQPGRPVTRACGVLLPAEAADAAPGLLAASLACVPMQARIEGQLAAFELQPTLDAAFRDCGFTVEPREFLGLDGPLNARPRLAQPGARLAAPRLMPFDGRSLHACASVLVAAHAGGVEARINESFCSEGQAMGYLRELVDLGGCGRVDPSASAVALRGGRIAGFCVASSSSADVGHVPQIAVLPTEQGRGVGAFLLAHAVERLRAAGHGRITLSVTRSNGRARSWYGRAGFRLLTTFASYHRDRPA